MYKLYLFGVIINNYNRSNYRLLTVDRKVAGIFSFLSNLLNMEEINHFYIWIYLNLVRRSAGFDIHI